MSAPKTARDEKSKSPLSSTQRPNKIQGLPSSLNVENKPKSALKRRQAAENLDDYNELMKNVEITPGVRPKRMNAAILISSMEDIYTARFLKDTSFFKAQLKKGGKEEISNKSFPDFIYEFFKKKKNSKKLIQQSCQDLIWSLEYHRKEIIEADLFAKFLSRKYDTRDLVFYLYTRCLLEKEVGVKFSGYGKVNPVKTTDPRELILGMKTCRKIATIFFEDDENELNQFLDKVEELTDDKKIQCTKFLMLLLDEFHTSKNSESMQKSLGRINDPFDEQDDEEDYTHEESKNANPHSSRGKNCCIIRLDINDENQESLLPEESELRDQILSHISENRISQLITFMLNSVVAKYSTPIAAEMLEMLQSEIKEALFSKISDMLDAIFTDNIDEWLRLLMIDEPDQDQINYYEKIRDQVHKTGQLRGKITLDNIDDIAKMVRF